MRGDHIFWGSGIPQLSSNKRYVGRGFQIRKIQFYSWQSKGWRISQQREVNVLITGYISKLFIVLESISDEKARIVSEALIDNYNPLKTK